MPHIWWLVVDTQICWWEGLVWPHYKEWKEWPFMLVGIEFHFEVIFFCFLECSEILHSSAGSIHRIVRGCSTVALCCKCWNFFIIHRFNFCVLEVILLSTVFPCSFKMSLFASSSVFWLFIYFASIFKWFLPCSSQFIPKLCFQHTVLCSQVEYTHKCLAEACCVVAAHCKLHKLHW